MKGDKILINEIRQSIQKTLLVEVTDLDKIINTKPC